MESYRLHYVIDFKSNKKIDGKFACELKELIDKAIVHKINGKEFKDAITTIFGFDNK